MSEKDQSASGVVGPWSLPSNFWMVRIGQLYRSGQPTYDQLKLLRDTLGLQTVISFRLFEHEPEECQQLRLVSIHLPQTVYTITEQSLVRFLQLITDSALWPALCHCYRGSDRTGVYIASYRIAVQGWSPEAAITEAKQYGLSSMLYPWLPRLLRRCDWTWVRSQLVSE